MGNFVFQDLEHFPKTVWREGDPPLVNGSGQVTPQTAPQPTSPRGLLWVGVLSCIIAGAWLAGYGCRWQTPATPICAGAWVILCLLAVVRAWRRTR